MSNAPIKVAIVGLDTSHSVELPKLMVDPKVEPESRVPGLFPTRCLRFETPFQKKEGLDARQAYLESIGVMVTEDFDTAVADCDAILIEINDASRHLEYFEKCAPLGKPIFLDKPFADTLENARKIRAIAAKYNVNYFTCSCLRFCPNIQEAKAKCPAPREAVIWGPMGIAAAGSSIVWYGVHATEMAEFIMGPGATTISLNEHGNGYMAVVGYADGRRAMISLNTDNWQYGGVLRDLQNDAVCFNEPILERFYRPMLVKIEQFFRDGKAPVENQESFEVMAILDAMDKASRSGKVQAIYNK